MCKQSWGFCICYGRIDSGGEDKATCVNREGGPIARHAQSDAVLWLSVYCVPRAPTKGIRADWSHLGLRREPAVLEVTQSVRDLSRTGTPSVLTVVANIGYGFFSAKNKK